MSTELEQRELREKMKQPTELKKVPLGDLVSRMVEIGPTSTVRHGARKKQLEGELLMLAEELTRRERFYTKRVTLKKMQEEQGEKVKK